MNTLQTNVLHHLLQHKQQIMNKAVIYIGELFVRYRKYNFSPGSSFGLPLHALKEEEAFHFSELKLVNDLLQFPNGVYDKSNDEFLTLETNINNKVFTLLSNEAYVYYEHVYEDQNKHLTHLQLKSLLKDNEKVLSLQKQLVDEIKQKNFRSIFDQSLLLSSELNEHWQKTRIKRVVNNKK